MLDGNSQQAFYARSTARLVHSCTLLHHIGGDLHRDPWLIERVLSFSDTPKSCPISHLIPRIPYGIACRDSSLTADGGFYAEAKF